MNRGAGSTRGRQQGGALDVQRRGGVPALAGHPLQMDGVAGSGVTFLSHAHVRLPLHRGRFLTSDITAHLLGPRSGEILATPFRRSFSLGPLELCLWPSGHVPGAAALEVTWGGQTLLYAGQVGNAEAASLYGTPGPVARRCKHVVLAAPYGDPRFRFPPASDVAGDIAGFCRDALAAERIPLLMCHPFGKAQLLAEWLRQQPLPVRLHPRIHRPLRALRGAGLALGELPRHAGPSPEPAVLMWPIDAPPPPGNRFRRALVSGRAIEPEAAAAWGCEAAFPLSDLAGFDGLIAYVADTSAERCTLLDEPHASLRESLAALGVTVAVLGRSHQLTLFQAAGSRSG